MSTKTVYDVIDTGVNYLLSVYDSWNIEDVLDKENDVFPIHYIGNLDMF